MANFGPQTTELKWCYPLKFLGGLEIDPGYLAHTPTGTGVFQEI